MATKLKPSEAKKKLKSRLEALAKRRDSILDDAGTALEEMHAQLPTVGAPALGYDDPAEPIEDAIDEVRDCLHRLDELAEKMQEVMADQAELEEQLEQLEAPKKTEMKNSADATLDRIALALRGEWDSDVFSEVAAMVRSTGRKV